jgi:hypothetical protein
MNPRKSLILWQEYAECAQAPKTAFALGQGFQHDECIGDLGPFGPAFHCDPFPINWLGPLGVEPFFSLPKPRFWQTKRTFAEAAVWALFAFVSVGRALESLPITTNNRGKKSCGKSSLFFLSQPRLQAACKTPARAVLLVPFLAQQSRTIRTPICWLAQPLAALQALRPVPSRARSAARNLFLTAQKAVKNLTPATQGETPFGWLFHFAPGSARPI